MKTASTIKVTDEYIEPLYKPYLSNIQKALICAYCEWSGEKRQSWSRMLEILNTLARTLPGSTKATFINAIIKDGWTDSVENGEILYALIGTHVKDLYTEPLEHLCSKLNADIISTVNVDAKLASAFNALSHEASIILTATRPREGAAYYTVGIPNEQLITVKMSLDELKSLQKWINNAIADLQRYGHDDPIIY